MRLAKDYFVRLWFTFLCLALIAPNFAMAQKAPAKSKIMAPKVSAKRAPSKAIKAGPQKKGRPVTNKTTTRQRNLGRQIAQAVLIGTGPAARKLKMKSKLRTDVLMQRVKALPKKNARALRGKLRMKGKTKQIKAFNKESARVVGLLSKKDNNLRKVFQNAVGNRKTQADLAKRLMDRIEKHLPENTFARLGAAAEQANRAEIKSILASFKSLGQIDPSVIVEANKDDDEPHVDATMNVAGPLLVAIVLLVVIVIAFYSPEDDRFPDMGTDETVNGIATEFGK